MSGSLRHIRVLSDGRPGHENQSVGLAEALGRRTGATYEVVRLDANAGFFNRLRAAKTLSVGGRRPDLIIAAGHRTHLALLAAARHFCAKSVVIMKPTLPAWLFDLCLVPRHDLRGGTTADLRIIATRGALNRLPETGPVKTATGIILIGGPSKHHEWESAPLVTGIEAIMRRQPQLLWTVANSRRTPGGFFEKIAALKLPVSVTLMPHEQTTPGWLPAQLSAAQEAWVTEDSTSMIFEAITARARVGLLPMRAKRGRGRLLRAVEDVVVAGCATRYADWAISAAPPVLPVEPLHEAGRCADEILRLFFTVPTRA